MSSTETHHQFAFEQTQTHKGLKNSIGENNCFLNVTIQALWHLGPFRANMKQLMSAISSGQFSSQFIDQSFILALCNLFIQYEFAEEEVLPPDELRILLSSLNEKFGVGKIADANEALDAILQRIHNEFSFLCPSRCKCLAHQTFGIQILEQYTCGLCGATDEPRILDNFLMVFQSMEFLEQAARFKQVQSPISNASGYNGFLPIGQMLSFASMQFQKKSAPNPTAASSTVPLHVSIQQNTLIQQLKNRVFGVLLKQCMVALGQQSCPSTNDPIMHGRFRCGGKALPRFSCLDPPLSLALSFGWSNERETSDNIHSFLSLIPSNVFLQHIFPSTDDMGRLPAQYRAQGNDADLLAYLTSREQGKTMDYQELDKYLTKMPEGPSYGLQGMICYYGLHYVSIFLDHKEDNMFLLFDDQRVRPIGNWADVISLCVRSLYQPVLLIYELEDRGVLCSSNPIATSSTNFIVNYAHILRSMQTEQCQPSADNKSNSTIDSAITAATSLVGNVDASKVLPSITEVPTVDTAPDEKVGRFHGSSIFAAQSKALDAASKSVRRDSSKDESANEFDTVLQYRNPIFDLAEKPSQPKIVNSDEKSIQNYHPPSLFETSSSSLDASIADIRRRYNLPGAMPMYTSLEASSHKNSSSIFSQKAELLTRRPIVPSSYSHKHVVVPIISFWAQKPLRYTCHVPIYDIQGKVFIGLQFSTNTDTKLLVVTTFAPHPITQCSTWIERSGRIQLMDQVVSMNGFSLRGASLEEFARILKREMTVTTTEKSLERQPSLIRFDSYGSDFSSDSVGDEPNVVGKVRIEFQSEYTVITYFRCPECADSVVLDSEQEELLRAHFNDVHKHRQHDASMFVTLTCTTCKTTVRAIDSPFSSSYSVHK